MKRSRYKVGSQIVYENTYGTVKAVFHDGNEWRYEVTHKGWVQSVPERALLRNKAKLTN